MKNKKLIERFKKIKIRKMKSLLIYNWLFEAYREQLKSRQ